MHRRGVALRLRTHACDWLAVRSRILVRLRASVRSACDGGVHFWKRTPSPRILHNVAPVAPLSPSRGGAVRCSFFFAPCRNSPFLRALGALDSSLAIGLGCMVWAGLGRACAVRPVSIWLLRVWRSQRLASGIEARACAQNKKTLAPLAGAIPSWHLEITARCCRHRAASALVCSKR